MADNAVINTRSAKVIGTMIGKSIGSVPGAAFGATKNAASNIASNVKDTTQAAVLEASGPLIGTVLGKTFGQFAKIGGAFRSLREQMEYTPVDYSDPDNQLPDAGVPTNPLIIPEAGEPTRTEESFGPSLGPTQTPFEETKLVMDEQTFLLREIDQGIFALNSSINGYFKYKENQDKLNADRMERLRLASTRKTDDDDDGFDLPVGGVVGASMLARMFPGVFGKKPKIKKPKMKGGKFGKLMKFLGPLVALFGTVTDALEGFEGGGAAGAFKAVLGEGGLEGAGKLATRGAMLGMMFGPLGAVIGGGLGSVIGYLGFDRIKEGFEMLKKSLNQVWGWMKSQFDFETIKDKFKDFMDGGIIDKMKIFARTALDFMFPIARLRKLDMVKEATAKVKNVISMFFEMISLSFLDMIPDFVYKISSKARDFKQGIMDKYGKTDADMPGYIPQESERPSQGFVGPMPEQGVTLKNPLQMTAPKKGFVNIKKVHGSSDVKSAALDTARKIDRQPLDPALRSTLGLLADNSDKQVKEMQTMGKNNQPVVISSPQVMKTIPTTIENAVLFLVNRGDI